MARYKIATKTDVLRHKIAKEVFGEVEDCDGIRDVPSWEIFEKTLEQHKQLALITYENKLLAKALELACGHISYVSKDTFIRRAEEELNNGNSKS